MPLIETHAIRWACDRCRARGTLPQLDGATIADVRYAIVRGHERRSAQCHRAYAIKHVRAVQDGKVFRFGATLAPASSTQPTRETRP